MSSEAERLTQIRKITVEKYAWIKEVLIIFMSYWWKWVIYKKT